MVAYTTRDEKGRQIRENVIPLHHIACYFSDYEVNTALMDDIEALLVRSFANNLLNKRMKTFASTRKSYR